MPLKNNLFKPGSKQCPLCNGKNLIKFAEIDRFENTFNIDKCLLCNHIFMNPLWKEAVLDKLYLRDYYEGSADFSYHDERKQLPFERKVWQARLKKIRSFKPNGNFCDVGCSFGGFLSEASQFFMPFGVEISSHAAGFARKVHGSTIFLGSLENVPWKKNSMDVITAIEVIEHLESPKNFLQKAGFLLKPGGLLVLQTADFDALQAQKQGKDYHYFLPGHLHYFRSKNLKEAMRKYSGIDKVIEFRGTDFGLTPKLKKSRGNFTRWFHYLKWLKISIYHIKSKIKWRGKYLTSAMVLYGFKK